MLRKTLYLYLVLAVAFSACESDGGTTPSTNASVSTRRVRFTRRSTESTPKTTIEEEISKVTSTSTAITLEASVTTLKEPVTTLKESVTTLKESTDEVSSTNATVSIESSVVKGDIPISVEISTKKSLRAKNCGERIGDDIPFIAILVHTNPFEKDDEKKKKSLSKGVLISETFVMATVSSVYHSEPFWTVSSVRLGDFVTWNKYAARDKSHRVEIDVDEVFYHKKKDLALIKLKDSVTFTDVIKPACLPSSDSYNFKELRSHLCKRLHSKAPADVTMEFAAPLSSFDCRQFFSRKRMTVTNQEFCVWDETGDDCTGDIGNPLFTIHNGRFFIVGLRSYVDSDEDIIEPTEYPGVYVKIGAMLNWISTVINYDEKKAETL